MSQDKDLDIQNPLVILWSLLWSPAILLRMALQLGSGGQFLWDECLNTYVDKSILCFMIHFGYSDLCVWLLLKNPHESQDFGCTM